jgi:lipopolysaccharide/colanic/teichoic acid biosynthesis glycosyltransferase
MKLASREQWHRIPTEAEVTLPGLREGFEGAFVADVERRTDLFDADPTDTHRGESTAHPVGPRAVPDVHAHGPYERFVKPVLDRLAGLVLSILTLPIVLVVVPLIWLSIGRPAIFEQVRIGRFGKEFKVYKFRTMTHDRRAELVPIDHEDRRRNHKSADDPRHTDIGRFLRKWSLDEIPQFWNVLLGSMSLVGPRPELPHITARYEPWQHRRHEVKPGLTGLWQISARGEIPMHEATDIDVDYVDNITFLGDMRIILKTPAAMLGVRRGG